MLLDRVTTILPLSACISRQLLYLRSVEAVKLAQVGFGDFLAETRVSRLKGKRDVNEEVHFVDTICKSAGHK